MYFIFYLNTNLQRGHVNSFSSFLHLYFHRIRHILCMLFSQMGHVDASLFITPRHIAHSSPKKGLWCLSVLLQGKHIGKANTRLYIHDACWITQHAKHQLRVRVGWI